MSFTTALSGLKASSNLLSVTGNNISNANTTGFKKSRSEFADIYVSSMGGVSNTTPGAGVQVANVAQQFMQGNLQFTDNNLDLAISGEGFFMLGKSPDNTTERSYTRNGAFHTDDDGYVVNNLNQPLLVYKPNGETVEEGFSTGVFQPLQIDTTQGFPRATSNVNLNTNLDALATVRDDNLFVGPDANGLVDASTYNHTTSATIYDSLGTAHQMTVYYEKTAPSQWRMYTYVDGVNMPVSAPNGSANANGVSGVNLTYDNSGKLLNNATTPLFTDANGNPTTKFTTDQVAIVPNADPIQITLDLDGSTQLSTAFSVGALSQDGLTIGRLNGVTIDDKGIVFARYTNGATRPLGEVALARFQNPQGLSKLGDTEWAESAASGGPVTGEAGTSSFGSIKSGALEGANLELADQLVTLIVAQQSYQANAQTIQTENQITQTLLNLR